MSKPLYVLGTGLSHNGSAVLLKDGKVCVGIEKERLFSIVSTQRELL
jgi:carbamoyltransferase